MKKVLTWLKRILARVIWKIAKWLTLWTERLLGVQAQPYYPVTPIHPLHRIVKPLLRRIQPTLLRPQLLNLKSFKLIRPQLLRI